LTTLLAQLTNSSAKLFNPNGANSTMPKFGSLTKMCVDAIGVTLDWNGTVISNVNNSKFTAGMSLQYNINCDRSAWLCSIGGLLAMPLAYATAVEIYNYALTVSPSQRVNTAVVINKGNDTEGMITARDLAAEQYDIELKSLLQNMRLPDDPNCWSCRNTSKYVTALP
jgi:hypothetical protein